MFLENLETWIIALSSSLWVYPALFTMVMVDGFFPPVPSESVVITLAVASWGESAANLWVVLGVAMVAAWTGDQVAYWLGRRIGTERIPFLRSRRGLKAVVWARHALATRGASFILAARYVPVGRVAVNMSAGALGFPRRRFMVYSGIAAVAWGLYAVAIGIVAAQWLGHNMLLAMAVGVVLGVATGLLVDRAVAWWSSRPGARPLSPIPPLPAELVAGAAEAGAETADAVDATAPEHAGRAASEAVRAPARARADG
ncbi:DedA family protein [Sediminihabitans luteus]|uniref:DedA family protein n=1 Tax=Sediminihabitans luteus TaxID=1138585 RepID=UPI001FD1AFD0|nr:DedA family protein [Sediminihabitans luteus]